MPVVWGVDVSTKCAAIAVVRPEWAPTCVTIPFAGSARGAARLADAHMRLVQWLPTYAEKWGTPDAVFVEEPAGAHVPRQLTQMVGVVLCALGQVVHCPIVEIPVARWKGLSVGRGNAKKPEVLHWARMVGYVGASEDEADALGVATAGTFLLGRELAA